GRFLDADEAAEAPLERRARVRRQQVVRAERALGARGDPLAGERRQEAGLPVAAVRRGGRLAERTVGPQRARGQAGPEGGPPVAELGLVGVSALDLSRALH